MLIASLWLAACGGGSDSSAVDTGSASGAATLGAEGGSVMGPGGATVQVPPGALAEPVTIRMAKDATDMPALPAHVGAVGDVFTLAARPPLCRAGAREPPLPARALAAGEQLRIAKAQPRRRLAAAVARDHRPRPGRERAGVLLLRAGGGTLPDPGTAAAAVLGEAGQPELQHRRLHRGHRGQHPGGAGSGHQPGPVPARLHGAQAGGRRVRRRRPRRQTARDRRRSPGAAADGRADPLPLPLQRERGLRDCTGHRRAPGHGGRHRRQPALRRTAGQRHPDAEPAAGFPFQERQRAGVRLQCVPGDAHLQWRQLRLPDRRAVGAHRRQSAQPRPAAANVPGGQQASRGAAAPDGAAYAQAYIFYTNDLTGRYTQALEQVLTFTVQPPVQPGTLIIPARLVCDTTSYPASSIGLHFATPQQATLPGFGTQPRSMAVRVGQTASFTAVASGFPSPALQWMSRASAVDTWEPVTGAAAGTLTTAATTLADNGRQFKLVATNPLGSSESQEVTLTVNSDEQPPVIGTQPAPLTILTGSDAAFAVAASGTGVLSYQWRFEGQPITAANAPVLRLTGAAAAQAGRYSVVVVAMPRGAWKATPPCSPSRRCRRRCRPRPSWRSPPSST
ncbi:hypothetical protein FSC37_16165 [Piscinibacter aquaticus]|uniref:Immunoglobulin domain-containing protein n=1 Tax=Piscinibacter aquaticus TaxID=392597 RepID=A0A5C6U2I4_9BURK|nr:hypothetical protein FSC37_16165 [Piscinibacter aquaticus]